MPCKSPSKTVRENYTICRHATATAFPGRQQVDYLSGFDEDGGDYYSILGLDPGADKKSIKKAYHNAMRDCHPDSNHTDEAHEFATFVNEIHEVGCTHLMQMSWVLEGCEGADPGRGV